MMFKFYQKEVSMAKKQQQDMINDVEIGPKNVSRETLAPTPTLPPAPIPGLTAGRMVHYVLPLGSHRPAIITNVIDPFAGNVSMCVFRDGEHDGYSAQTPVHWVDNILYNEDPTPDTWHFIEKA
jgi:hypothetical protein